MQDRLASRGELMNFDNIPSVLSSINKDGLFGNDERNYYASIGDFLTKEFKIT